jgi:4-hydroxy-2-oxoheptanedioate aldolase
MMTTRSLVFRFALASLVPVAAIRAQKPVAKDAPAKEVRLNRVIELMEAKKPALGIFSFNHSVRMGASVGGSRLDFVIIDLEHGPYDVSALQNYLLGMIDKRQILRKGNLQPNVVPLVRVPAAGREQLLFVIKQVLDLGVFGLVVPHVDTAEDALAAVRASRYPQLRDAPDYQPEGLRGIGYSWPARSWGLSGPEYATRADLWPLDPKGEILLWLMIETRAALKNIRAIASTPGVSGLFIGPSDLAFSMGLPLGHPEVETAMTEVVRIAQEVGVPCGTLCSAAEVEQRLAQGYRFLAVGSDSGLSSAVQDALRASDEFARKAGRQQR